LMDSSVKLTEKMKLQCIYLEKAVIIQTLWMKLYVTHKENTAVLLPIYGMHRKEKYNGRIYFENASRDDKSLSFIKSTLEDDYLYICFIAINPDGTVSCWVLCFSTDIFQASEKQNNPAEGNVAFTCPYEIGNLVQQELWERIKADWADIVVLCNSSGKQSFGSDFKGHTVVDYSDQSNSGIVFQNITTSNFATYCSVASGRNKTYVKISTVAS
ncbi:CD226 protein, partial [Calyptomena viridis]|nr:CD226 protein [Calyptomena viridis]